MKNFNEELEYYVQERMTKSVGKAEKTKKWRGIINKYDALYGEIYSVLSEDNRKKLEDMLCIGDRKTVAEICIAYKCRTCRWCSYKR